MVETGYFVNLPVFRNNIFNNNFLDATHLMSFLYKEDNEEPEDSKKQL